MSLSDRDLIDFVYAEARLLDELRFEDWLEPVSYTHLDVYKRQPDCSLNTGAILPRPKTRVN